MANYRLNPEQLAYATALLADIREKIRALSNGNPSLYFALNRKIAKELLYDERGKPGLRAKLKAEKRKAQNGICPICKQPLPDRYCVLDREEAEKGYTTENTRLLCLTCDQRVQAERNFRDR